MDEIIKRWIVEVSRSDKGFARLAGFAEGGIQQMCFQLSDEFYSEKWTRERDELIARCYNDEKRPPWNNKDNWKETLEWEIEDRIREELVKLPLRG